MASESGPRASGRRSGWVSLAIKAGVVLLLAGLVYVLVTVVPWGDVWDAMKSLQPWMFAVLALLVVVRQFANAAPLAVFVPEVGYYRAMANDTSASVVATVAPPPADLVVRFAMFRAWGIDLVRAASGLTLNTVLFYILRFATPLFGLVVLFMANRYDDSTALIAAVSGLAAVALALGLVVVARSDRGAAWIGRSSGRLAARVKPQKVQPDAWEERMREFRAQVGDQLSTGWARSSGFLLLMVATEAVLVVAAMRFVGIPSHALSVAVIIGAFSVTYLMTALPLGGLGALDVALYAILVREAGSEWGPSIIAGLIIWRVATMLVPLIIGAAVMLAFRRKNPDAIAQARADRRGSGPGHAGSQPDHPGGA